MKWLPDVNVLVALVSGGHVHHDAVQTWFAASSNQGWCTTPLTELGLLRILCHPSATDDPLTWPDALDLLRQIKAHPHWRFVEAGVPAEQALDAMQVQGHNQINDAYLLGLAVQGQMVLTTFDKGFTSLLKRGDKRRSHVQILPAMQPH